MLEKNLKALEHKTYIYEPLMKLDMDEIRSNTDLEFGVDVAKNGTPILLIQKDDKVYRMNSAYNPQAEAEKWASQFDKHAIKNVVSVYGFGNGEFIRALMKNNENTEIIVYEPSVATFLYVLENFECGDVLGEDRVKMMVEGGNEEMFDYVYQKIIDWGTLLTHKIGKCANYEPIFADEYLFYCNRLKGVLHRITVHRNTEKRYAKKNIQNIACFLKNYKDSYYMYDLKEYIPNNTTGIIVSAGPSLKKNISVLKELKGKALIFAVSTAVTFLLENGVEPDFVFAADPQINETHGHFKLEDSLNIPKILLANCSEYVQELPCNRKLYVFTYINFCTRMAKIMNQENNVVPMSGSVATLVFSTFERLGIKRIVFVGQDLCFGENKQSHIGHTETRKEGIKFNVEDIYGNVVETRHDWIIFLEWFEDRIEKLKDSGIQFIDATEGGARIKGTELKTLEEVKEEYCNVSINTSEWLEKLVPCGERKEYCDVKEYIHECMRDLELIRRRLDKDAELNNRIESAYEKGEINSVQYQKDVQNLMETNNYINEFDIKDLIYDWNIETMEKNLIEYSNLTEDEMDSLNIKTVRLHKDVLKTLPDIKKLFKEIYENM